MNNTSKRINSISDFISNYESRIRSLNKLGLYDEAVLFELFALEICTRWFNQNFKNLNVESAQFPVFDLISEDGLKYVQVSTEQNLPSKIKKTLEKLKDSTDAKLKKVSEAYFFMLSNSSEKNVKAYKDKARIGKIDFDPQIHLITTDKILEKAKTDLVFQKSVYDLIISEESGISSIEKQLAAQIDWSRRHIKNISCLINDEYEIDRKSVIENIKNSDNRIIMVSGDAGSGKSALCRRIVEDEPHILFARAEKIVESGQVDDIWDIGIESAIRYMGGKPIVIFIDALEFIADTSKTKLDILDDLCHIVTKSRGTKMILSCRTADIAAFHKIVGKYNIRSYELETLKYSEIFQIAQKYPIISQMAQKKEYSALLSNPLYIDLITKHLKSIDCINDVNEFRTYIWDYIICQKDNLQGSNINSSDISEAVSHIALTRAKDFVIGIDADSVADNIRKILLSNDVIIEFDGKVRLKKDIFEDIFFERYIDKAFTAAKGNYIQFFHEIEEVGKCVNRRYQIWVENKLLATSNRDKFLYTLLNTKDIPEEWMKNTIVGIVLSDCCGDFFTDYKEFILNEGFETFLNIINTYSYNAYIYPLKYENYYSLLSPIGEGRRSLIKLINESDKFTEKDYVQEISVLCSDYAESDIFDRETAEAACTILESYSDPLIKRIESHSISQQQLSDLKTYLHSLYLMSEYSCAWTTSFLKKVSSGYISAKRHSAEEDLIEYTIHNPTENMARHMGKTLLELACLWWLDKKSPDDSYVYHSYSERSQRIGLSRNANDYSINCRIPNDNIFYRLLLEQSFWNALEWAILLTNHVASRLYDNEAESDCSIEIIYGGQSKNYIGTSRIWACASEDPQIHELVDDTLFLLRNKIFDIISNENLPLELRITFARKIKQKILNESNNVMMLSVLSHVGLKCRRIVPDLVIDFLTNPYIIAWDTQRAAFIKPNVLKDMYKQELLNAVGMPFLENRYSTEKTDYFTLTEYAIEIQISDNKDLKNRLEHIIDVLYVRYPDCDEFANENLTIQKMDIRKARFEMHDELIAIVPEITGSAANLIEKAENSLYITEENKAKDIVNKAQNLIQNGINNSEELIESINEVNDLYKHASIPRGYDPLLIMMIAVALKRDDLTVEDRSALCNIWLDGIDKLFIYGSFIFDKQLLPILFDQHHQNITEKLKERMRKTIVRLMLSSEITGTIRLVKDGLVAYLKSNNHLANEILAVLCKLSYEKTNDDHISDEMIMKVYNSIKIDGGEKPLNIDNASDYLLAAILECGLDLCDENYKSIVKRILLFILERQRNAKWHDGYASTVNSMRSFCTKMLESTENAWLLLDLLFEDVNEELFSESSCRLYEDILEQMSFMFFDSYNDVEKRGLTKKLLLKTEEYIESFSDEKLRNRLSIVLILPMRTHPNVDWNDYPTSFSYDDKMFLNNMWTKYGEYHLRELLITIYGMHICELLPEVIVSLNNVVSKCEEDSISIRHNIVNNKDTVYVINRIITTALISFCDQIKSDSQLLEAYENLLELLMTAEYKVAAVILNDFRVH